MLVWHSMEAVPDVFVVLMMEYQCSEKGWKCGAVALVPQNTSAQVTSGLKAIQLIGL